MGVFFGGFVGSENILDGAVTTPKIANNALTSAKINAKFMQAGSDTTASDGTKAITFATPFDNTPKVKTTGKTAGWIVDATSITTTGFTAVARSTTSMSGSVSGTTAAGSAHTHTITLRYSLYAESQIWVEDSCGPCLTIPLSSGRTGVKGIDEENSHTHAAGSIAVSTTSGAGVVAFDWIAVDL